MDSAVSAALHLLARVDLRGSLTALEQQLLLGHLESFACAPAAHPASLTAPAATALLHVAAPVLDDASLRAVARSGVARRPST